jgi:hypothetical protein
VLQYIAKRLLGLIPTLLLVGILVFLLVHLLPGDPARLACPSCGAAMEQGALVPMGGVHWREIGAPIGLPSAFGGLPGTVGWRGRPRLHAARCTRCEVVTFRYGRTAPAP